MKRRKFVKNTSLFSASTFLLPSVALSGGMAAKSGIKMLDSVQLTDFDDEQDECPILFQSSLVLYQVKAFS